MAEIQRHAGDIEKNRRHFLAEQRLLPVLVEELLDLGRRHPFAVFDQALDRTELLDQLNGRFFTDAADPRNVVRHVAHQALEIDGLNRFETVALPDTVRRVEDRLGHTSLAGQDEHIVIDELEGIQVAGDDRAVQPLLARLPRQRADDVVRLDPLDLVNGYAEGAHDVAREWELRAQLRGRRPPGRFVLCQLFVAEGPASQVERRQYVVRMLLQGEQEHRRKAVGGVDDVALAVSE